MFSVVVGAVGDLPWPLWIVLEVAAVLLILAAVLTFGPISIPGFELVAVDSGGGREVPLRVKNRGETALMHASVITSRGLKEDPPEWRTRWRGADSIGRLITQRDGGHLFLANVDPVQVVNISDRPGWTPTFLNFLNQGDKAFTAQLDGVEPVGAMLRVKSLAPP